MWMYLNGEQNQIINVLGGHRIEIAKIIFTFLKKIRIFMFLKNIQSKICPFILRFILLEQPK